MAARSTKSEVSKRVEETLQVILLGGEINDLREHARAEKWGVCDGTIRRYMTEAWEEIAKRVEKDRDRLFARHLLQRRTLFARAMEQNDIRTALAVVKDEAELQGMYPAANVNLTGKVTTTNVVEMTDEQLAAIAAAGARPAPRGRGRAATPPPRPK